MYCTPLYCQSAVSLFISFRLSLFWVGNISGHLCWLLTCTCNICGSIISFYMNQSQFNFSFPKLLFWTHQHILPYTETKNKKMKIKPQQYLTVSLPFFYLAWSGKDHWHHVRRSWERYGDFFWYNQQSSSKVLATQGYYFIPFFLLLCSWPIVEQNSIYNNNILIQLFLNIELGRVITGENHLFWTSKWTTVKFYSLCNYFCSGFLVDFLFSLSPRPRRQWKLKIKLGDL